MNTESSKLAMDIAGESTSRIMALDGTTADDVIYDRKAQKLNDMVDAYSERFEKHSTNIKEFADKINENVNNIEILPLGNYVLIKPFEQNPFQRIVRSSSGLIIDTGGFAPEIKNTDSGEYQEEEQFIKVGVVQEVGPECRYLKSGDAVFYAKPSEVPVPFYKQGLVNVNETRILAVVSENLTNRFKEIKNNK